MTVLQYVGSIAKDYTNEEKPLRLLMKDGIMDMNNNVVYAFEPTNNEYERSYLDISQSTSVMIPMERTGVLEPEFYLYYIDNDGFINELKLYDFDPVNNWYKIENKVLQVKAIIGKPLHYFKDFDDNKWIYYYTDVKGKILARYNVFSGIAEKVQNIDMAFVQDFNLHNGYGVFNFNALTDNSYIEEYSFLTDRDIEFPNNFYITALAIKMAMAYKIKQGADVSLLEAQYTEMIAEFYNSQSNDVASFTRMGNVY